MSEYTDKDENKSEHEEKSDDKSTDNFKDVNDKPKQDNHSIESSESETLRDDQFEPKRDLKPDADDFVPDEKYKSIDMDFIPDREYKPDIDSFEPRSEISLEFEDFKPDKNYDSDNDLPELNSKHKLNADQEKDDKSLEPDREYEQDDNSLDEKSKFTDSRVELDNDGESDIPVQTNENQGQSEIGEQEEHLQNKDEENPLEKSNEELNEGDKEEFGENVAINHEIDFEYLLEHDLKDLIEEIKNAEKEGLIYANDSLITVKEFNSNEKLMTEIKKEMYQNRVELNENSEVAKSEDKNAVLIENLDDFRLRTIEFIDQKGSENMDRTQAKTFTRVSKKEFSRNKREDTNDKGGNSGDESGLPIARDSRQYTVQVSTSETQSLNQSEKSKDSSEKSLLKEETQQTNQEEKEKKEEEAARPATKEKRVATFQSIKLTDNTNKTKEIVKQELQKDNPPSADKSISPETRVSKELNYLKEKYRQESGKRPIYRGKETKGFVEWKREKAKLLKHNTIDPTNSPDSTSDSKNQKNADFQRIQSEKSHKKKESKEQWTFLLRKWVNEANENDMSSESKKELTEYLEYYRELRENYKELEELIRKHENRTIAKNEFKELTRLLKKFKSVNFVLKELFVNFRAFRKFYLANEIWYKERIEAEKEEFTKFLAQKAQLIKKKYGLLNKIKDPLTKYNQHQPINPEQNIKMFESDVDSIETIMQYSQDYAHEYSEQVSRGNRSHGTKDRKSASYYDYIKSEINKYISEQFKGNLENIENIKVDSIKVLADKYKVTTKPIVKYIKNSLYEIFQDQGKVDNIFENFWPKFPDPKNSQKVQSRKIEFKKLLDDQWSKFYQSNKKAFDDLSTIAVKIGMHKDHHSTVINWLKQYCIQKSIEMGLSASKGLKLYKEIWGSKKLRGEKITWERITKYIESKNGVLETNTSKNSNPNKGTYIKILCNNKHLFKVRVGHLLYDNQWCLRCQKELAQKLRIIGIYAHYLLSLSTLRFFSENVVASKYEEFTNPDQLDHKGTKHKVEVLLPNKENL